MTNSNTPIRQNTEKVHGIKALIGISFFMALVALCTDRLVSAIAFSLLGLMLLTSYIAFLKRAFGFLQGTPSKKVTSYIVLVFVGLVAYFGKGDAENSQMIAHTNSENVAPSPNGNINTPNPNNIQDNATINDLGKNEVNSHYVPYKIVYKHKGVRYDGGLYFLVLINPVNLHTDAFKNDVRKVINEIAQKEGKNIAIDIFDNRSVLEAYNRSDEINRNSSKDLSKAQEKQIARHGIATYTGGLETMVYKYQLDFFPSSFSEDVEVGKYNSSESYEPDVNVPDNNESDNAIREIAETKQSSESFTKNCMSDWDGSCKALASYVKENMNNPSSFEHVETRYSIKGDHAIVIMKYRGTNAFGAIVTNWIKAKVSFDCQVLQVLETE